MKKIICILLSALFSQLSAQIINFDWAVKTGGPGLDYGLSVLVDSAGNVYSSGTFGGTVDFDPGPGTFNMTALGPYDAYVSKLDSAGNFIWAKRMGGSDDERAYQIAFDPIGNLCITGYFATTADFDPGPGTFNITTAGFYDIFICKLDNSGNFIWAKSMGGSNDDEGRIVRIDESGNIYAIGYFIGTADFDPGPGIFNLTSAGNEDMYITKLDNMGNFIWAKKIGGTGIDHPISIDLDASGNLYTTGSYEGIVDFDPGAGIFNLTSLGSYDIYLNKLDNAGNFIWAKSIGAAGVDYGHYIKLDSAGNIYTTGYFTGTVDFNPNAGTFNMVSAGMSDIYLAKYTNAGSLVWSKRIGAGGSDFGYSVVLDTLGYLFSTGFFSNTVDFDPGAGVSSLSSSGSYDVYINKMDTAGNFIWAGKMGGTGNDQGFKITNDPFGNLYTIGFFSNTADFDPSVGIYNLTSSGTTDVFLQKMWQCSDVYVTSNIIACDSLVSPSGNYIWFNNGSYMDTVNYMGTCDSIFTINLTINHSNNWTDTIIACSAVIWIDGNTYSANNNSATYTLTNISGCDSTITLNFTIGSNTGVDVINACDSIIWIDGITYTSDNNTATDTLTNIFGCDSVVTLNLTIGYNTGTDVITACDSIIWLDGNTYTSNNNTATFTLTNIMGCDSIVTLNLTMNYSNFSIDNIIACDSINWIDGNTYTSNNSTATHTLTNTFGCDSVITLNLTINNSINTSDLITVCDSITWIDGNLYTSSNNTAIHTLTNTNGCDSIVHLNLTILNSNSTIDSIIACESYTWIDGNTYSSSNNSANITLINAFGCDSIVTINLTINNVDINVTQIGETLTATSGGTYQWIDCNNGNIPISGETNQTFTASSNGSYSVVVNDGLCTDTSLCYSVSNLGITNLLNSTSLKIFPIPTHGQVNIQFNHQISKGIIRVTDITGKIILEKTVLECNQYILDLSTQDAGIYLFEIIEDDRIERTKIIKN